MRIVVLSLLAAMIATPAVAKCGWFSGSDCRQRELAAKLARVDKACQTRGGTAVERAQCINQGEEPLILSLLPPADRDLLNLKESYRVAIAKRVDDGAISIADADVQFNQLTAQINSEQQQRQFQRDQLGLQQQQNLNQMYQNLMPMIVPQAPVPPPMTTCHSQWYGGVLTTRCF